MRMKPCVLLLLAFFLPLSFAYSQSSPRITMTQEDYEQLLSLVSELSLLNDSLQSSMDDSLKNTENLENEIKRISNDLSELRESYQQSLSRQEYLETHSAEVEALLHQADESLKSLIQSYEGQLLKLQTEKRLWKMGLGALNLGQAATIIYFVVKFVVF